MSDLTKALSACGVGAAFGAYAGFKLGVGGGAAFGTVVPGAGTVAGAGLGAAGGTVAGAIGGCIGGVMIASEYGCGDSLKGKSHGPTDNNSQDAGPMTD